MLAIPGQATYVAKLSAAPLTADEICFRHPHAGEGYAGHFRKSGRITRAEVGEFDLSSSSDLPRYRIGVMFR